MHYQTQRRDFRVGGAVGVDTAKEGVWKQLVYKDHLDGAELRVN